MSLPCLLAKPFSSELGIIFPQVLAAGLGLWTRCRLGRGRGGNAAGHRTVGSESESKLRASLAWLLRDLQAIGSGQDICGGRVRRCI